MFNTFVQELTKLLGRSYLVSAFLPLFVFIAANVTLYFELTRGLPDTLAAYNDLSVAAKTFLPLAALIAVAALAWGAVNLQTTLQRLFSGDWPASGLLGAFNRWRTNLHRKRWQAVVDKSEDMIKLARDTIDLRKALGLMTDSEGAALLEKAFPRVKFESTTALLFADLVEIEGQNLTSQSYFLPTQLGNYLNTPYAYAYLRYRIDAAITWPRLRPLLKQEVVNSLDSLQDAMNSLLLMSLLSGLFSVAWCPLLALWSTRWDLFLLCAASFPLAWLLLYSAEQTAIARGEQLKMIFDLYRDELLDQLKPLRPVGERTRTEWKTVATFLREGGDFASAPVLPVTRAESH